MTDPIGTAQERELIERLRFYGEVYAYQDEAADALQSRIAEVGELRQIIAALGYCTADASLEFMRLIPAEVEAKCAALSLHRRPTDIGGS